MDNLTPVLQTYSILAATLAAGTNLASTMITLPVILDAEKDARQSPSSSTRAVLATKWQTMFDAAITPVVTLAMTSSAGFAILAYRTTLTPILLDTGVGRVVISRTKQNLYAIAALGTLGLLPYTLVLMGKTNDELKRRAMKEKAMAEDDVGKSEGDTSELITKWGRYNFWRGTMLLSAAVLGTWASLE